MNTTKKSKLSEKHVSPLLNGKHVNVSPSDALVGSFELAPGEATAVRGMFEAISNYKLQIGEVALQIHTLKAQNQALLQAAREKQSAAEQRLSEIISAHGVDPKLVRATLDHLKMTITYQPT